MILRPYQENSQESLRNGFRNNHTRQVLCASTGAGKSIIMLSMIQSAHDKDKRVLFICERRILVEQFSQHLDSIGLDHGILMSKHWRFRPDMKIQVASAQTLEKMESLPMFDIVFIDEIHACMRKSVIRMIETFPNLRIVGATATPFNPKLGAYFTNIVNVVTMRELVDDCHLVPFRVFAAKEINTEGLKTAFDGEFEKKGMETRARMIVGDVVSDYVRLSMEIFGELRKGIIFTSGIAHGADLSAQFNEVGINAIQISCKDDDEYKAEVLADFRRPDSEIKLVLSSEILERGFDQSDIDFVILAKAVKKSFSKFVQMVGRGARLHPGKEFCVIQDHGNNWLRFSDDWNKLYGEGVTELTSDPDKTTKKEPTAKEKEAAKCPKCGALWPSQSDVCTHCGMVRVRRNDVLTVAGEMLELDGNSPKKEKYTGEFKENFYRGLLGYSRSKGMKDGWAFYAYQDKFHVEPKWEKIAGIPDADVIGFITHRNIKNAKRKSA